MVNNFMYFSILRF